MYNECLALCLHRIKVSYAHYSQLAGKVLPYQDFGIVDGVSSVELHDCSHDPVPRELIVVASSIAQ